MANRPASSAARAKAPRSAISTRPAASATPSSWAAACAFDRLQADGRHVEPQVLIALGRFDEHARFAFEAQAPRGAHIGDAREHRVGAFRRLDRQDAAVGDDDRLARVERRERLDERACAFARRQARARLGGRAPSRPRGDQQARRDLVHADHAYALGLKKPGDADQEMIVAAAKQRGYAGQRASRRPNRAADRRIPAASSRRQWRFRRCRASFSERNNLPTSPM